MKISCSRISGNYAVLLYSADFYLTITNSGRVKKCLSCDALEKDYWLVFIVSVDS